MTVSSRVTLSALLCLLLWPAGAAGADKAWVRLDLPAQAARAALPEDAIDYGHFIWLPAAGARELPGAARRHRVERPFDMVVDGIRFDPAAGFPDFPDEWSGARRSGAADFHLVQFEGPIREHWLEALRETGIEPLQYLAPFAYIVWAEPGAIGRARGVERVRFADQLPAIMRVPRRSRQRPDRHSRTMAMIYRPQAETIAGRLQRSGARVVSMTPIDRHFSLVDLEAGPGLYARLAGLPGVLSVQQIGADGGARGEMTGQSVSSGLDDDGTVVPGYPDWLAELGFDGDGMTVAIVDGGIRESHDDLAGQFTPCQTSGQTPTSCTSSDDDHGTHVAGAVAGTGASGALDGNGFLRGLGMAPGATMVQQRFAEFLCDEPEDCDEPSETGHMIPDGMLTIFHESALSGAAIANNSWGPTSSPQGYDIPTRQVDIITRDADPVAPGAQPVLPVWAIANGDGDSVSDGECNPSTLGSPDEAKNLLAVGSGKLQTSGGAQADDIFDLSFNSAHGPACDGRRVPHLIAPGCHTDSPGAASDDDYNLNCGTSMAAPVVAGSAALFFQQYQQRHGSLPSPALTKAVFAAAARDLAGQLDADGHVMDHRPDRKQGWGRLNAAAALQPEAALAMIDQTKILTATGETWSGDYAVHRDDRPVNIRLAWTDAPGPGLGGTTPAWVNDLDLIVEIDGVEGEYVGNAIDPATGLSITGGTPDGSNNLEGVALSPAQHQGRDITITVLAANLADNGIDPYDDGDDGELRQDFALAATNSGAPGTAVEAAFLDQPADVDPGQTLPSMTVAVVDAFDDPAAGPGEYDIEITAEDCSGSCTLSGTTLKTTTDRTAEFDDLAIDTVGRYRLHAQVTDATVADGLSEDFIVGELEIFSDRFQSP